MTMDLLFSGDFDAYLREAYIGERCCIFVHVPKTAGTSLRSELAARLQPDANIAIDYWDSTRSFHEQMDDAVARTISVHARSPLRFASGHLLAHNVERLRAEIAEARFVTFLRHPVTRVVSDYCHQRSSRHPGHERFTAEVPSLEAYLELPGERNKMVRHLVPDEIVQLGGADACIDHLLRCYHFIGVQEMYPIGFRTLTGLTGNAEWPQLRRNVGEENSTNCLLSPHLVEAIRAAHSLDCAVHDAILPRWQSVRDALVSYWDSAGANKRIMRGD